MSTLLYLGRDQVIATGVTMAAVMVAVRDAFTARGEGRAQAPPKSAIYPHADGFLNAMPASVPSAAGIKWVSAYTNNASKGLPNIHALIVLNEVETGRPLAVMDGGWITAMRTGAVSGLCAQELSVSRQPVAAIVGAGVQGRSNLEALMRGCPPRSLWVYDRDERALDRYVGEIRTSYPGLEVGKAKTPRAAVMGADVVITATAILKEPRPVIQRNWVKAGALGLPLDYDSYWSAEAINDCDRFWVDDMEQFESLRGHGYFSQLRRPDGDLGQIFAGQVEGRGGPRERLLVMSLGLGIADVATAWLVYCRAREEGIGSELTL